jgi:serine palmitoyltransferase
VQNDPWRSLLELSLIIYVVWTFAKPRTRGEGQTKYWVNMSEKVSLLLPVSRIPTDPRHQDIDALVQDFEPAPLVDAPASKTEAAILPSVPTIIGPASHKPKIAATGKVALNLASPNWSGFLDNERLKEVAIKTLREYGTSPCGPPGFYGTLGTLYSVAMKARANVRASQRRSYSTRKRPRQFRRPRIRHHLRPGILHRLLRHPRFL